MRRRWIALLACAALAATFAPPPTARAVEEARAVEAVAPAPAAPSLEGGDVERVDSEKFWSYAACAASIALAAGTGGWILVALACGRAATAYWTR